MDIQESKAVVVTNISPSANEKTVSDFFSFCGKITKLFLKKEEGVETSTAVVQFETESAAKTALLLTNALIIDRPITVSPYSPTSQTTDSTTAQASLGTEVDQSKITQREFNVPDDERSKTSVVASLLAAGYSLGTDAFQSARDFDDKHLISLQAKVAVEQVKVKAHELDKQLGISEKAQAIEKAVNEKVKQLDESWKISEKANLAASTLKNTVEAVSKTAATKFEQVTASNPTLAKGMETIKTTADSVKNTVANTYQEVVTETNKAIEEKQKEKAQNAPVTTTTTTTTTTTDTTAATDANIEPAVTDSVTDLQQPTAPGPQ